MSDCRFVGEMDKHLSASSRSRPKEALETDAEVLKIDGDGRAMEYNTFPRSNSGTIHSRDQYLRLQRATRYSSSCNVIASKYSSGTADG